MEPVLSIESGDSSIQEWYRLLVIEKSANLSDFMASKRKGVISDFPDEREQTIEEIIDVISTFPSDFLHKADVSILLDYFLNSIESSALTGGAVIRGVHHLILKSNNLPDNFEMTLIRILFKEGNMQSWAQKERNMQYDILMWLLKNKLNFLKSIGHDFLTTFMKSVSGERDPRCLVKMFAAFLEITSNFFLAPFTEDMFETIACYFPIEFKPQKNDTITREYLSASCSSCLVSHPSFAPYCFLFIDEKINDEDCSDEEYEDVLNLLILACERFPPQKNASIYEPLVGGIRKIGLNPKNKGEMPKFVSKSLEAIMTMCTKAAQSSPNMLDRIVNSIVENSEPFVLQAEMGLCKKALTLLRSAFKCVPENHAQSILSHVIAWILNLIHGDSVNSAANRAEIVQEGLEYLIDWIRLASEHKQFSIGVLNTFEQSIFESCIRAREFKPREAIIAIYECASVYVDIGCSSEELVSQCRSYITLALRTPIDTEAELHSLLKLIKIYSSKYLDQVKIVLNDNPANTWNSKKVLPVLCAISCRQSAWELLKDQIISKLEEEMSNTSTDNSLDCFVEMLKTCQSDSTLFVQQFESFEEVLFNATCGNTELLASIMQSISLLFSEKYHQMFMDKLTARYQNLEGCSLNNFNEKYRLSYLQNKNANDILDIAKKNLPERTVRQLFFAFCNRAWDSDKVQIPVQHRVATVKARLLRNSPNSLITFEDFLTNFSTEPNETSNIYFEYLFDFESFDSNPEKCQYETGSPLWRQRIFCQIVPIFKRKFEEADTQKHLLVEMLPHLLKFSLPLDSQQLKKQFAMLLPVLIETICLENVIPSHVTRTIPMFLTISEPLQTSDLQTVIKFLCSIVKDCTSKMIDLEDALNGLNILARRQPAKSLHSEVPLVVKSINKILGHKKRLLRMMAADVKNNWEMTVTK